MTAMIAGWEEELTGRPAAAHFTTIASSAYALAGSTSGTNRCLGTSRNASAISRLRIRPSFSSWSASIPRSVAVSASVTSS